MSNTLDLFTTAWYLASLCWVLSQTASFR